MFFILSSQDLRGLIIEKIPVLTFRIPFHFILGTFKGKSIVYTSTPFFSSAFTDCFRYSVTNCKLIGAERCCVSHKLIQ